MSNEANVVSDDSQETASGSPETGADMVKYDSYKKVLGEKKRKDEQLTELTSKLEVFEQAKLESEGRKDEVIASLRSKAEKYESELKKTRQKFITNSVDSQLLVEARNQGCTDTNAFLKLIDRSELRGLEVSDDFRVNKDDLAKYVESSKKQWSNLGLFEKKDIKVHDVQGKQKQAEPKSVQSMSKDELLAQLKNLKG